MIDFHAHILPRIDDGSQSVEESIELLRMLAKQDVTHVIATPHYDATRESPERFLERRQRSYETLKAALPEEGIPEICLGAEVMYFPGIGGIEALPSLCFEGTNLLLMEMPMATWGEYAVRELTNLACQGQVTLILAHVERYWQAQDPEVWDQLLNSGAIMQVNASYFTRFASRRRALGQLRDGEIHLLGSDCHSVKYRPPYYGDAVAIIRRKLGEEAVAHMDSFGKGLINPIFSNKNISE